jgi:hypothetical protein
MKIQIYLTKDINIAAEPDAIGEEKYGSKIVATVSRQFTWSHFVELSVISRPPQAPLQAYRYCL